MVKDEVVEKEGGGEKGIGRIESTNSQEERVHREGPRIQQRKSVVCFWLGAGSFF